MKLYFKTIAIFLLINLTYSCTANITSNETLSNLEEKIIKKEISLDYFVSAESGLNARKKPNGEILFKYQYGAKLNIVERTDVF